MILYVDKACCIAGEGYSWLQYLPNDEHFGGSMFDEKENIIQ